MLRGVLGLALAVVSSASAARIPVNVWFDIGTIDRLRARGEGVRLFTHDGRLVFRYAGCFAGEACEELREAALSNSGEDRSEGDTRTFRIETLNSSRVIAQMAWSNFASSQSEFLSNGARSGDSIVARVVARGANRSFESEDEDDDNGRPKASNSNGANGNNSKPHEDNEHEDDDGGGGPGSEVPEPSTLVMLGLGAAGLAILKLRR